MPEKREKERRREGFLIGEDWTISYLWQTFAL
jgi:hypothetical protein